MQEIRIFDTDIGIATPIRFTHAKTERAPHGSTYHMHDCLEIYIYVAGDVDFLVGDTYYHLRRGDVIFTLANELHRPVIRGEGEYERFYIQIPDAAFASLPFGGEGPLDRFSKARHGERLIDTDEETREELLSLLFSLSRRLREEETKYLAFADLLHLLALLNRHTASPPRAASPSPLVGSVLKHVSENALSLSGVREIATHFHVHPSYLSAAFSAEMGTGLKQYLIHKKISVSKELLLSGKSVTEVCYLVGFGTASHFIDTFRAVVGMTPGAYQKAARKETESK